MSIIVSHAKVSSSPQNPGPRPSTILLTLSPRDSQQLLTEPCNCKLYKAQGKVCPCSARFASRQVRRNLERILKDTVFFAPALQSAPSAFNQDGDRRQDNVHREKSRSDSTRVDPLTHIISYTEQDIKVGKLIGKGGFCDVSEADPMIFDSGQGGKNVGLGVESNLNLDPGNLVASVSHHVRLITLDSNTSEETAVETSHTNSSYDNNARVRSSKKYVIKHLRKDVMLNKKKFSRGLADILIEAHFLSVLNHPNIVKLHGITADVRLFQSPVASGESSLDSVITNGSERNVFLVLERLQSTLSERIKEWKGKTSKYESLLGRTALDWNGSKRKSMLYERLRIAFELASAMQYLHKNNIIYRDIKPDNIGFDAFGTLKLFDFGLAKELLLHTSNADGTYNLTGRTGSRRYMAPEVALNKCYNSSADVYSFGILLHEICSLEKPFDGYTEDQHMQLVIIGGQRPSTVHHRFQCIWPESVCTLIVHCWDKDSQKRPTFQQVVKILGCQMSGDRRIRTVSF